MNVADPFGLVGQVLDGQFRVDKLVGEGGFSAVYRGHHLGLDEPIAIKCLKLPAALDTALVDTFVQRCILIYQHTHGFVRFQSFQDGFLGNFQNL